MNYVYVVTHNATVRATRNAAKAIEIAWRLEGRDDPPPRKRDCEARKLRQGFPISPGGKVEPGKAIAEKVNIE